LTSRDLLLRACVLAAAFAAILTEALGAFHALRPVPVAIAWLLAIAAGIALLRNRLPRPGFHIRPLEALIALAVATIAALTAIAAWMSPPNSHDVLAYHLPRILYWIQSASVGVFPTPYVNQIQFPPLAEYLMLHTFLLTGGDHFVNLVSWSAFVLSIVGVTAIASTLGANSTTQAYTALFAATLPTAILQASSAKNESLSAFFLLCVIYFALRHDTKFLALSLALAIFTKGTAYLFAPPLIAAAIDWRRWRPLAVGCAVAILLINGPLYLRNFQVSGSPLGFDSPFANGLYRYRNDSLGWKPTVSNALLNLSDQLGSSNDRWNQAVYREVLDTHRVLGITPANGYAPPENTRHEANANNRWHLLLLAAAVAFLAIRPDRRSLLYTLALLAAYLLFCFYVRWYPYDARYLLAIFLAASPLAGKFLAGLRPRAAAIVIALLLLSLARLPATQNWLRPLKGPRNVFSLSRDSQYFADIAFMHNEDSYRRAVDITTRSACQTVGIDSSENQLEYPFQALLRERDPHVRFVHTGVENPTARYADPHAPVPCAVLCLDCIGNTKKLALYSSFGPPEIIGRFLLF